LNYHTKKPKKRRTIQGARCSNP